MEVDSRLLLTAVVTNALAAGATGDQAIKQLPARHEIGPVAYAQYVRGADLAGGLRWYPPLGIGAAVSTLGASAVGLRVSSSRRRRIFLVGAALGTVAHLATTARAAPLLLSLRHGELDAEHVRGVLDRFARINALRAVAMSLALAASIAAVGTPSRPE